MDFEQHPMYEWLSLVRRDFHMHPETAFQEFRTTAKIKEILTGLGIELKDLPGMETGALGLIEGRPGDKTLGLRADIDALPMTELNETPYKSTIEGVMHSCGHDGHATVMLGVAKNVVESGLAGRINGRLKFLFQPAEETVSGARAMIEAGALEDPPVDRIVGCHMWTDLPVGQVGLYKGVSHAAADVFRLTIYGRGAHGANPDEGIDPIMAGVHFASAVQTVISRNLSPLDTGVITLGKFQAGTAANIIPDRAYLEGTVRTFKSEVRDLIIKRMADIAAGLERTYGVETDYKFIDGVPSNVNDDTVTAMLYQASVKVLGEENVVYLQPKTGGEDFALYSQLVPGSFMRIGCANRAKGLARVTHSPTFDMDEAALPIGVEIFTQAIKDYLG